MEKRLLVTIFLSFLVLYAYQVFVLQPAQQKARRQTPAAAVPPTASQPAAGEVSAGAPPSAAASPASPVAREPAAGQAPPLVSDQAEREIVVETKTLRAVFTNRGARLESWTLKKYLDPRKQPQELVPHYVSPSEPRPFELKVDDAAATARMKDALFLVTSDGTDRVDATAQARTVVFEFKDAAGLAVKKTFTFEPATYVVTVSADVTLGDRPLNPTVLWGPGLGDQIPGAATSSYVQKPEAIVVRGDKVQRIAAKDIASQPVQEGQFTAAGVDDQYFIAMALPQRIMRAEYTHVVLPAPAGVDPKKTTDLVAFGVRQAQSMRDVGFFFGPKDFDVLEAVNPKLRLVRVINFGMFDFLAVPLLRALKWIHGYVGNYGWSILVLTFLINAVMFPLRHKSMVSMRKMQEIQPQVKAIQERYAKYKATDPEKQKMNAEMMSLYKEKGVNPAGGCVPMLLTFPILFAFYSLLSQAIEIRGEPFIWWIRDLSQHDPYYVTPILMGASQLWQQKMTPAGGDPIQQKMMMMMPLVFTFMFLWMPSGLTIYWFFSNLLAIGQQYLTNRLVGPPSVPRPPAERRLKEKTA
jgi:YidC/Oxa1 family membrane protein insertase